MLKLIIRQANWGILGSVFAFAIGFFVKTYVIREVGTIEWGKYATAHIFAMFFDTILSLGIPFVILKFLPDFMSNSRGKASSLIQKILWLAIRISIVFLVLMYFLAPYLDEYVYTNIDTFSYLLLIVSLHAPISIFMGIITSLFRSVLKIKEIILYGTFVSVPLRAILTFVVFQFTSNIIFFVAVEIFTQLLTLILMYWIFHKNEMKLFGVRTFEEYEVTDDVKTYGKKIYANSIVLFFSGQSLSFILGIMLPPEKMGVYSILLTITALSLVLNKNLRKIFAPVISKLYSEGNFTELNNLYKKTTFLISLFSIPLAILIIFFSDEILNFFSPSGDLIIYKPYLITIMLARVISLLAGNSGTFMVMAGLEQKELELQSIKTVLIISLALLFVKKYELLAIVSLYIIFMIFVNIIQLFHIYKKINISPFSKELLYLILVSVPVIWFSIDQNYGFQFYHYFIISISVYLMYFSIMYYPLKQIIKELL